MLIGLEVPQCHERELVLITGHRATDQSVPSVTAELVEEVQ
jgi:hypothetical protein